MTVSVRDLKNRLSEYLRRVRAGERLVVTERGRPIAEVYPLSRRRLSAEESRRRLVEAGDLTPGRGRPLGGITPLRVRGRPISETLLEDRG